MIFDSEYFMKQAYAEAELAFEEGEIPVGAVIVANNRVIAKAHNQTERLNDVTAHAEMLAVTAAANLLGGKYLKECKLYVTLEPCPMCAGALYWSQIGEVIYGASDRKRGYSSISESLLHPKTVVESGVLEDRCGDIVKLFFKKRR